GKALLPIFGPALMGYSGRVALLAGLAVSQIGEFSFVLAREGRGTGLLSEGLYQTFLAVAVLTMLVTPFLLQGGPALLDGLERLVPLDRLLPGLRPGAIAVADQPLTDHVIVAGYGLNGRNLTAALRSIRAPYLIVELNAQTVQQARAASPPSTGMPPAKRSCAPSARSAPACSSSRSPTRRRLAAWCAWDALSTPASTSSRAPAT